MNREDLSVEISGDHITVSGEKRAESTQKSASAVATERAFGSFRRALPLPATVEAEHAQAAAQRLEVQQRSSKIRGSVVHERTAAAISGDGLARDGPRLVGTQIGGKMGDFGRIHHAPDGVGTSCTLRIVGRFHFPCTDPFALGTRSEPTGSAFRAGYTGVYTVDGDTATPELIGECLGEMHKRRVARAPGQIACNARIQPTDVDDASPTGALEMWNTSARTTQRP